MNWRTVNLGQLVDNFSVRAKDHPAETSELEFCGVSNEAGITKSKYAAEDKAEDYKIIERDCFAYNPYRINVGSIGLLEDDTVGLISPAYVVFKPKPRSIIPQLLLKFLKSAEGLRQIKMHARGTVRQALRFEDLCKIEIAIPDYDEQIEFFKRISETEIESNIISTEFTHQLSLVKQLRQAFLREAMQGKLLPQNPADEPASELLRKIKTEKEQLIKDKKLKKEKPLPPIKPEEIPFEIPENWVWCRLGEIALNLDGARIPVSQAERERKEKLYDYYGASGVIDKIDGYTHEGRFLLIGEDGANLVAKSTPIAFIAEGKYWVNNHAHVLDFTNTETTDFMVFCLNSIDIKPFISGGFQPKLSQGNLNLIPIPLPPLSEQVRIVQKLEQLMQLCDGLEQSITQSQQQNEMLLQQVLREALEPAAAKGEKETVEG